MKAFVLISLEEDTENEMVNHLDDLEKVKNAYIIFGEWDIIAEVEVANSGDLGTFVMEEIRSREGVQLTSSLIVAG